MPPPVADAAGEHPIGEVEHMRLQVAREVDAPPARVWEVLTHWEEQPAWMLDARAVEVLTPARRGVGVTVRCPTRLLVVTVDDVMRVTAWEEPTRLAVRHLGAVIRGEGAFELTGLPGRRTRVTWWEETPVPLGRAGERLAGWLLRPVLARLFAASLQRLARRAEQERPTRARAS